MQARVVIVIPTLDRLEQEITEIVRTIALERLMEPNEPHSSP